MKKSVLRVGSACGVATLFFGSPSVHAFCTEFEVLDIGLNCAEEGHKRMTRYIEPMLRQDIWAAVWLGNYAQDNPLGDFRTDGQRHFESCRFATDGEIPGSADYIRNTYRDAIAYLDPADPHPLQAADNFGKLLHTVQDFYSHTNWINLLNLSAPNPVHSTHVIDSTLGEWRQLSPLSPVQDDIIVGQIPASGLPAGWSVDQELTSEIPVFTTDEAVGRFRRGLIIGWNPDGACPDVRPGTTVDEHCHVEVTRIPRTLRLVHGSSELAGIYGLPGGAYQPDRPCRNDTPTYICIQKDTPGRPDYEQALHLAEYQTAHEWCRLLHLAKDSQFGYSASSILMTLWAKPEDEPLGPHPITTACGTPPEVLTGKPGPIEVTVDPRWVSVDFLPSPDGSPGSRNLVFTLYTGDFRRSIYSEFSGLTDESSVHTEPMTMCVKPTDKLVATVWGWDDFNDAVQDPRFGPGDRVLRGETLVLDGPDFQRVQGEPDNQDLDADFHVTVGGDDPDGDGLSSACGETFYGTAPFAADTDEDGLNDGAEVNTHGTNPLDNDTDKDGLIDGDEVNTYGTNPLHTDTDGDELTDGAEVNTHGTNPADADSDDDGLNDGAEVNTHGTDPNNPDTDNDRLPDGIEVQYGTNPLLSDSDGDRLPDGQDVEWIEGAIAGIPSAAIKSPAAGNRNAMLNLLNDAEALLLKGKRRAALDKLMTLRMRIDGCGVVPDGNDWILDCAIQTEIRMLVDLLISNVSA